MKYLLNYDIDEASGEKIVSCTSKVEIEHKKEILSYLKKFPPHAYSSGYVYDKISKAKTDIIDSLTGDGKYLWGTTEVYYFEKYNLKLNDDFIQYVLGKTEATNGT